MSIRHKVHDGPVDVEECEAVPHVLLHLAARVLGPEGRLTQSDPLPVLPPPRDGWSVLLSIQSSSVNDYDKIG